MPTRYLRLRKALVERIQDDEVRARAINHALTKAGFDLSRPWQTYEDVDRGTPIIVYKQECPPDQG